MRLTSTRMKKLALGSTALIYGFFLLSSSIQAGRPQPTPAGKETGLIPREVFFGNPDKASLKISPDGKYLSYMAPVKGVINVWVAPIDDLSAARPVTDDKKRGIHNYFWAYTGTHILYVKDTDGDENWRVYSVDVKTGKSQDLTPLEDVQARISGVSHKFPSEIVIGLNDRDKRLHDLYRLNVQTGEKKLLQKNEGFANFIIDDDYNVRFGTKFAPDGSHVIFKPEGKDEWKPFLKIPSADTLTTEVIGFNETGDVLYLIDSRDRNTGALKAMNLKSGRVKVLAQNKKTDVGGVMMHPTKNTVQAVSFNYTRIKWKILDKSVSKDFKLLEKLDGDASVSSRTLDDRDWIVTSLEDDGPVRYYLYNRDRKKLRFLFTNRKELKGWPLQEMHPVVIKSRDNLNLVSYLTLPPGSDKNADGQPESPVPMVLLVHGGPWGRDSWGYNSLHQFLANRGYAVLSVNFRGSTGFGKNFINAGNREWAGKMHDDLIDAVNWAVKEKVAQADKIGIMGGSYGGYATLVDMTFTPETFACGVDIVGPSNIVTLLKTIPPYWAPIVQMFKDRVGDFTTEKGRKELLKRSPLTHVAKIKRPLLIGQGANDPRVKQAESDQIVNAMKEKKIPVTYILFPDEGHGFARPENKLAFFAVTEAFLAVHLGGRYQAIGDAFEGSSITAPVGAGDIPGLEQKLPATKQSEK